VLSEVFFNPFRQGNPALKNRFSMPQQTEDIPIYGLSAAIFTQNLDWAMKFIQGVESGNIHVNWGPQWRTDLMPYGGLKESGMGKEGPRYAVQEMTETKMVVMHLE
jgi:acyl-CoA reductase-like NAD-dependent aldehyde dehydrogenase